VGGELQVEDVDDVPVPGNPLSGGPGDPPQFAEKEQS